MNLCHLLSTVFILAFVPAFLAAQNVTTSVDRLEQFRLLDNLSRTGWQPEAGQPETEDMTDLLDDDGFGEQILLRRKPRHQPFRVFADAEGYFTDNAFISQNNKTSDRFGVFQVGGSYERNWDRQIYFDVALRQQFFRYAENPALDFDAGSLSTGVGYLMPDEWGGLFLFGRYNLQRLTSARSDANRSRFDEFLRIHTFTAGAQKVIPLNRYFFVTTGLLGRLGQNEKFRGPSFADPERNDAQFFVGLNHYYSQTLSWRAQYSVSRVFYTKALAAEDQKRRDWNQSLSLSGRYDVNSWLDVSLSGSFTDNASNGNFDYQVFNLGGALMVSARF